MRKKLIAATFAGAILLGTALPFVGSTAFADKGGCPNAAAANGAANANANSAHVKNCPPAP